MSGGLEGRRVRRGIERYKAARGEGKFQDADYVHVLLTIQLPNCQCCSIIR